MSIETIIFSVLILAALGVFGVTLRSMIEEDNPFKRRIRYASDLRSPIEAANEAALEAQKRRDAPNYMKVVVDRLSLAQWLGTDGMRDKLARAGYRFKAAEVIYLFLRFASPIFMLSIAAFYVYVLGVIETTLIKEALIAVIAIFVGLKLPDYLLGKRAEARVSTINETWPDSLDLMQIAVESGMTIETAIKYVADKIEDNAEALADELNLLLAQFSMFPERRQAFMALAQRVDTDSVRNFATVMNQAERSGTPIARALRTLSKESRTMRMREAETKAAKLGPKLTVPMILFFLPIIFIIIFTPTAINYFKWS